MAKLSYHYEFLYSPLAGMKRLQKVNSRGEIPPADGELMGACGAGAAEDFPDQGTS
ncbi:MAG: hypothetical protein HBSAPP04_20480 [Ignavibacteriaceae bacterium]|nr:MAG: hypothetical protein HBSAPP04_20480 [Ignavibacteriaceae bacterium]